MSKTCAACGGHARYETADAAATPFCDEFCQLAHHEVGGIGADAYDTGDAIQLPGAARRAAKSAAKRMAAASASNLAALNAQLVPLHRAAVRLGALMRHAIAIGCATVAYRCVAVNDNIARALLKSVEKRGATSFYARVTARFWAKTADYGVNVTPASWVLRKRDHDRIVAADARARTEAAAWAETVAAERLPAAFRAALEQLYRDLAAAATIDKTPQRALDEVAVRAAVHAFAGADAAQSTELTRMLATLKTRLQRVVTASDAEFVASAREAAVSPAALAARSTSAAGAAAAVLRRDA